MRCGSWHDDLQCDLDAGHARAHVAVTLRWPDGKWRSRCLWSDTPHEIEIEVPDVAPVLLRIEELEKKVQHLETHVQWAEEDYDR